MELKVKERKTLSPEQGRLSSPALGRENSWFLGLQTPGLIVAAPSLVPRPWPGQVPSLQMVHCGTSESPRPREPIPMINFLLPLSRGSFLVPSVWSTSTVVSCQE